MVYQNRNYQKRKQETPNVLAIILVGIFKGIWFLIKLPFGGMKKQRGISVSDKQEVIEKRREIEDLLEGENIIELKHAVMESDKLVDHILKLKGYQGETFADRLRSAQRYIEPALYDRIWQGHKVRNTLAHEQKTAFSSSELKSAARKLLGYCNTL